MAEHAPNSSALAEASNGLNVSAPSPLEPTVLAGTDGTVEREPFVGDQVGGLSTEPPVNNTAEQAEAYSTRAPAKNLEQASRIGGGIAQFYQQAPQEDFSNDLPPTEPRNQAQVRLIDPQRP